MKNILFVLFSMFAINLSLAQTGSVAGVINDGEYNDVLAFANVIVKGTQTGTTSDFDSKYNLNLAPGTYTLQFSFVGYQTKEITEVAIAANQTITLDVTLNASAGELDEVIVTATARQNIEASVLSIQKNSVTFGFEETTYIPKSPSN